MGHAPFSLRENLIAYDDRNRASRLPQPPSGLEGGAIASLLGVVDFVDDDSVHADHWECHPAGDEILCVLEGRLLTVVEQEGETRDAVIEAGQAFIVPSGCWHRLQVIESGRMLFYTPTAGMALRPCRSDGTGAKTLPAPA
jgi:mannose-6-phosphate isomerase-like protein (cupin superfamily)